MIQVFLSYASSDGQDAAARLADLLRALGVTIVDAAGATPAPQGAGVIAVLTPAALTDRSVLTVLQKAPVEGRPLLPLSAPAPANFPTPDDLARILEWRAGASPPPAASAKYHVVTAINSSVGDYAFTVNTFGQAAGWSAAETTQLVTALHALRAQQTAAPLSAQELRSLFAGLQAQIQQVDWTLRQGFTLVLARFDLNEQRILSPILARLDAQEAALLDKILDVLDVTTLGADELDHHLAAIDAALAEVSAKAAQIRDAQLVASAQQVAELAGAPGLDAKHKLKVTLPIIPVLVSYEGEIELSSRLNLAAAWQALRGVLDRPRTNVFGPAATDQV